MPRPCAVRNAERGVLFNYLRFCASVACTGTLLAAAAPAAHCADFYAGKTIEFLIGSDVGGGVALFGGAERRNGDRGGISGGDHGAAAR
jgi:hypothetical protein